MNKIFRLLFSPASALILLLIFAISMATATFVENDFSTQTARTLIYNSWWFEVVMLLLTLNFIANIFKYKLYRKGKTPILLFHLAFVIILIGAGITRFTAYEGIMRIREGGTSNTIISDRNFIQLHASTNNKAVNAKKELYFSPLRDNNFSLSETLDGNNITITFKEFIADATLDLKDVDTDGESILEVVVSEGEGRENRLLKKGEIMKVGLHQHEVAFQNEHPNAVNIRETQTGLEIKAAHTISSFVMAEQKAGNLEANSWHPMTLRTLYRVGDLSFVPVTYHKNAKMGWVSASEKPKDNKDTIDDILILEATVNGKTEDVELLYRHGFLPSTETKTINDVAVTLSYGATPILTPFEVKLNDFELVRYPGSTSPSSYASEITLTDKRNQDAFDYRIYMNNVLDYDGYRFFQASYDTDEQGTVLAVNHDRPGTYVTYIGYFLMGLGMLWTLFGKGSRFSLIQRKLKKLKQQKVLVTILLLFLVFKAKANNPVDKDADSLVKTQVIDKYHASLFGRLMVQDLDGRIKPINSLASEFLRKISRRPYYKTEHVRLDANQTFLAIHANPEAWSKIPLIKIDPEKGGTVFNELERSSDNLVAFNQFIKKDGDYILESYVAEANTKKPAERSEFDKEIIKVDERFNILYNIFSGNYLKIFPLKDDETQTWYSPSHNFSNFKQEDSDFAKGILPIYFRDIYNAKSSGDWTAAENDLAYIKKYQQIIAADIMPSQQHLEAELWYNELNLYFWLFQAYWTLGLVLLVMAIYRIFSTKKYLNYIFNALVVITLITFIIHTGNLLLRWYVAQHAPWSNGYEMITFVAWSIMLFGIVFYKKSDFTLPLATLFAGTLLFVSYLDWLSPEITNLMPVLKSYWLKIHVATIISSYAPLALSALLGLMALILMIVKNKTNSYQIELRIKELSYINELSMTIGLFILSIGTFLGGVWANESWGRYWAWDPKETWALISIIVYAIVLHLHFVPKLNNRYVLNLVSVIAFFSIIMTSFGVNYYLTGLHSYATGDPVPIPKFVYVIVAIIVIISALAYYKFYNDRAVKHLKSKV
ncbi:cytochrome c biogenesis protein CcsA [Formosa sp. A9]|uniref:cytochrome c biogenesis protein n=1 Tax=Formosa sp. A9 TaxID=3442641 RepID=UPI003EBF5AC8